MKPGLTGTSRLTAGDCCYCLPLTCPSSLCEPLQSPGELPQSSWGSPSSHTPAGHSRGHQHPSSSRPPFLLQVNRHWVRGEHRVPQFITKKAAALPHRSPDQVMKSSEGGRTESQYHAAARRSTPILSSADTGRSHPASLGCAMISG